MLTKNTLIKDISLEKFNETVLDFFKSKRNYVDDLHNGNYRLSYTFKNKEYEIFNGIDLSSYLFEAKNLDDLYYIVYKFLSEPKNVKKRVNIVSSENKNNIGYDISLKIEPYYLFTYDEIYFYLGEDLNNMNLEELSYFLINMLFVTENDDIYANCSLKCIKV